MPSFVNKIEKMRKLFLDNLLSFQMSYCLRNNSCRSEDISKTDFIFYSAAKRRIIKWANSVTFFMVKLIPHGKIFFLVS